MNDGTPRVVCQFPKGTPEEERREQAISRSITEAHKREDNRRKWSEMSSDGELGPIGKAITWMIIATIQVFLLILVYVVAPEPYKILALCIQLALFTRVSIWR